MKSMQKTSAARIVRSVFPMLSQNALPPLGMVGSAAIATAVLMFAATSAAAEEQARVGSEPDPTAERSNKSVSADLESRKSLDPALIQIDLARELFPRSYDFRQHIEDTLGLTFGMDYTTLSQWSSHTGDGQDFGMSQVLRALGTWRPIRTRGGSRGELVWKTETRTSLGGNPTPRDLGFNSGSALSTANFKELRYWGVTDLYWKQLFQDGKYGLLVGHMDPGDWADQYPLLNAWTSFMNDAFYNLSLIHI